MKTVFWILLVVSVGLILAFLLGPRGKVDRDISFDPQDLGEDLDAWLSQREAVVPGIRPGVQKRIVWANEPGGRTPISIVYLHGFSATSEEIRPVPDIVAEKLGANLYFARLAGHGRDGAAMAEPDAGDWLEDAAEAFEIGRRIGGNVVVIGTSTGGTLATLAVADPALARDIAGLVLVSPNFGLNNPSAGLLTLPWARYWIPLVAGAERGFETRNEDHAAYWTSTYPTVAAIPMMALVEAAGDLDLGVLEVPALFVYSEQDQVVSAEVTGSVIADWGGNTEIALRTMGPEDDPGAHVIAGDIMSPGQTEPVAELVLDWISELRKGE